jgi:succinate dehydrogenase / fumarate reductase, cytochrome b subunit
MTWLKRFLASTLGLKAVMAVTGLLLFGFVIAHMLGNLQLYMGAPTFNHYGNTLQSMGELLWLARLGLLAAVVGHIASAAALVKRSRAARPVAYKKHALQSPDYAARTMRFGGLIVFLFIVYHLLHLTAGVVHPDFVHYEAAAGGGVEGDAFHNVVAGFQVWWVSLFYVVAQVALGLHLAHGAWSGLRTLGLDNPRYDGLVRKGALAFAALITIGNCSIPLAVLFGIVG